jgi:hypothetical protein
VAEPWSHISPQIERLSAEAQFIIMDFLKKNILSKNSSHVLSLTMISHYAIFTLFAYSTYIAIASPISSSASPETLPGIPTPSQSTKSWSKEAIITLVGVFAAVSCFIIGLAWPKISRCISNISGSECFSSSRLQ